MSVKTPMFKSLYSFIVIVSSIILVSGCQQDSSKEDPQKAKEAEQTTTSAPESKALSASEIAKKYLIVDTHIDVPYRLENEYEDISQATVKGDFDFPRAKAGGLDAPFMSIYIPASLQEKGGSKVLADKLIDMIETIIKNSPQKYAVGHSTADVEKAFQQGLIALPMGIENGSPIEGDLANLKHFYERGVRYITLTHSKANHISDSSYDSNRPAAGLTDFGKNLVVEMNKLGVMIDVSHISDEAFYQVMEISRLPVIASHSSARHFTPGFERNMSDEMIKLMASKGGVIQINFGSTFIAQASLENHEAYKAALAKYIEENKLDSDSDEAKAFTKQYREKLPFKYATLSDVLDHFDHVVKIAGIDHVGIGSDYDGVGDSLPEGLKDVSTYPALVQGFLDRGYSEQDIEKILSGNLMRVWKQNEAYAAKFN